ncbi:CLUMA_CG010370, isoform A [Clunio marinus]|uniref:CLUMA_CG010370, isoform A n=1 Tax=Clunio marinus TaxID=568069 RepID=A0A1J1I9M4_9DIPT|nr:CLUMA_CG010370, isoform A [Clunio marinus]
MKRNRFNCSSKLLTSDVYVYDITKLFIIQNSLVSHKLKLTACKLSYITTILFSIKGKEKGMQNNLILIS